MFSIEKLIQSCNYLIKKNGSPLNYTKLIKLLYLADKASLKESSQTITGDKYVSMDSGPVLSKLYDLIKGRCRQNEIQSLWDSRFIRNGYELDIATDRIPQGELSEFEIEILDKIYDQFRTYDFNGMIKYAHNNCPEWKDPNHSSIPIPLKDVLKSLEKTPEEIEWILEEAETFDEEDQVFLALAEQ